MLGKFAFGFGECVPGLGVVLPNLAIVKEVSKPLYRPSYSGDNAQHAADDVCL